MGEDIHYGSFTWDAAKEKTNIHRHRIDFREALKAFADPRRIIARDDQHSHNEERLFCIGVINNRVATVRFTVRGRIVRIFGAGFWRKGRKLYEKTRLHRS